MMSREHLLNSSIGAFRTLFEAYDKQARNGEKWFAEMTASMPPPVLKKEFEYFKRVGVYPYAQCIGLLGDNLARVYCLVFLENENQRKEFGTEVRANFPLGKLLWLVGNCVRHYANDAFLPKTEEALVELGVTERDESLAMVLLTTIAGITTCEQFVNGINSIFDAADAVRDAAKAVGS